MGRNRCFISIYLSLLLALGLILSGTHLVQAGDGDGSGGGQGQPLEIVDVFPANGAVGVDINLEQIKVTFSKNIAYLTVRENNRGCFSLRAEQEPVPVDIIIADDQIERDKRNEVVIKPQQQLRPGTVYSLKIAPQLESKSGVTLGQEIILTFTTAGSRGEQIPDPLDEQSTNPAAAESEALASEEAVKDVNEDKENKEVKEEAPPAANPPDMLREGTDSSPSQQNEASPQPVDIEDTGADAEKSSSWTVPLAIAGIIAAVAILVWWTYRRWKKH